MKILEINGGIMKIMKIKELQENYKIYENTILLKKKEN